LESEEKSDIQYLNTDLEVHSEQDLSLLVEALYAHDSILYPKFDSEDRRMEPLPEEPVHFASFELNTYTMDETDANDFPVSNYADAVINQEADIVINGFCDLIVQLPPQARQLWDCASTKIFDLGFCSGEQPRCFQTMLAANSIRRIADLGASLTVTIYPPAPPMPDEIRKLLMDEPESSIDQRVNESGF
jgi:hypothetical protein